MNVRTKRCLKVLSVLVTVALIAKTSYELKWFDLLWGIFRLETHPEKVQSVSLKSLAFVTLARHEIAFLHVMSERGWLFVKHYGRGMIFEKEGYEILITKRDFFNRYSFYEVTTREIFEAI